MRRKTYVTLLIALPLLVVAWLVSGTVAPNPPEGFTMPMGASPPSQGAARETLPIARLDAWSSLAVSTDGGFRFQRFQPADENAFSDPIDLTSVHFGSAGELAVTNPTHIWTTPSAAQPVTRMSVAPMNENTVITCGARSGSELLVGTSFEGLWHSDDGGATWSNITEHETFDFMYRGAGFYEQVSDCGFDGSGLVFGLDFGNGFYRVELSQSGPLIAQHYLPSRAGRTAIRTLRASQLTLEPAPGSEIVQTTTRDAARGRHGIYLSASSAAKDLFASYLDLMEQNRYDSIVVDFKDDEGRITYETQLEKPHEIGAVSPQFDARELIAAAKSHGIYLIARVVVFKDRSLYFADDSAYAVWDRRRDAPWGRFIRFDDPETGESRFVQREYWVDPFSPDVWQYNIDIARELEELGVDEIQFDYIRFPSDGPTQHAVYRHGPESGDRVDAIAGFLATARSQIEIPIGIDVFGFNAWFRTRYLGQDIAVLSRYVDVISPMNYPSHFARAFLPEMTYFDRSRYIYEHGSERAAQIARPDTIIRPYVQAFLIGPELAYEVPEYSQYLIEQLEGTLSSPADGFTLWNASGRYYMVTPSVTERIGPLLPIRSSAQ